MSGKAPWVKAFPEQSAQLRSAFDGPKGIKCQSGSQRARMDVYVAIRGVFMESHPFCQVHLKIHGTRRPMNVPAQDVHHKRGRIGLYLFDVRYWVAVCRKCHDFIHAHPKEAARLGLLEKR